MVRAVTALFDQALALTLQLEGGLEVDATDLGGRTMDGITQGEYDSWRIRHDLPVRPVDFITSIEMRALYFEDYWTACRCEELPAGLGAAVFDMAVNSGPGNAARTLQEALGIRVDGAIGPMTLLAAANAPGPVLAFLKARSGFYVQVVIENAAQIKFFHGWVDRLLTQAWTLAGQAGPAAVVPPAPPSTDHTKGTP